MSLRPNVAMLHKWRARVKFENSGNTEPLIGDEGNRASVWRLQPRSEPVWTVLSNFSATPAIPLTLRVLVQSNFGADALTLMGSGSVMKMYRAKDSGVQGSKGLLDRLVLPVRN
jgi:hypothetical protein